MELKFIIEVDHKVALESEVFTTVGDLFERVSNLNYSQFFYNVDYDNKPGEPFTSAVPSKTPHNVRITVFRHAQNRKSCKVWHLATSYNISTSDMLAFMKANFRSSMNRYIYFCTSPQENQDED